MPASSAELGEGDGADEAAAEEGIMGGGADTPIGGPFIIAGGPGPGIRGGPEGGPEGGPRGGPTGILGGPDAAEAGNGGGPPNATGGLGGIGGGVAAATGGRGAAAGLGDGADPELRDASLEASIDIMSPPPPPPPIAGLGASSFLPTMGDDLSTVTVFFSAFLPKP